MRSEKLLVYLKPKFLGDVVMATPMLRVLAGEFSNRSVLVTPRQREMLQEDHNGYEFLAPGPVSGLANILREAKRLRGYKFETAVLVNRSIRSALIARFAGIPKRIGHNTEYRSFLLTTRVPYSRLRYEAACYGDLVEAMGIPGDFTRVHLTVTDEELRRGSELAQGASIGIQPGASFAAKALPADRMSVVATLLIQLGHRIVLLGGPEEASAGEQLQSLVASPMVNLIGKTSLREAMGALASLKACIGGSTGIMHIAAAVGCPTVTVFGPTLYSKWVHNYPPHQSVRIPTHEMKDLDPGVVIEATKKAIEAYPG